MKIQCPAQFVSYRQKVDKSLSLTFSTQEIPPEEMLIVLQAFQQPGWLLFSTDKGFTEQDVPKEDSGYEEGNTPSKRLRSTMYVWYQQKKEQGKVLVDFETFYRQKMESLIEQIKNYLD